ncbi:hypothetical protein BGX28_001227 [Mortierella sp. GBA30]|nr:hypothetical protein BGX28_001227 [Mortierella sp. GBA30]
MALIATNYPVGPERTKVISIFGAFGGLGAETRILLAGKIWKNRTFTASVVLAFVAMEMFQGVIYFANMIFQEVYGWSSIRTALGFLVHSLLAVVVFTILGRILPRLPLKPRILAGFLLRCVTTLMIAFVKEHTSGDQHGGVLMKGFKDAFFGVAAMSIVGFLLAMVILPWDKHKTPPGAKSTDVAGTDAKDLEIGSSSAPEGDNSEVNTIASQNEVQLEKQSKV